MNDASKKEVLAQIENDQSEEMSATGEITSSKEYDNLFNIRNDNFIISSALELSSDKTMKVDLDKDGKEEMILIGLDHPTGIRILGIKGEYGTNLIDGLEFATDEHGDIMDGFFIQASHVDLDKDGKDEVLMSVGDKSIEMRTAIYKVRDAEEDSFKLVGIIEGQSEMYLDGNHIIVPYGSQGLFDEYIYDKGTLFKSVI